MTHKRKRSTIDFDLTGKKGSHIRDSTEYDY